MEEVQGRGRSGEDGIEVEETGMGMTTERRWATPSTWDAGRREGVGAGEEILGPCSVGNQLK